MRKLQLCTAVAALALGACRDLPTTPLPAAAPSGVPADRLPMHCAVTLSSRTLSCHMPPGPRGMRSNLVIGGQGLNVRLTSSNTGFSTVDSIFHGDVVVQNLLDQTIGTNGTDTTGVRVFFNSGPTVTSGTGQVTVLTDSVGTFLASNQKYYKYDEVIEPRATSQPVTWQFKVQGTVSTFEFLVYVEAQAPGETSILHWRPERGTQVYLADLWGVWAASAHDVYAVSDGAVLHYDGNYWRATDVNNCGCGVALYAVWGAGASNVFAVGAEGAVMRNRSGHWVAEDDPDLAGGDFYGVWGSGANDVWAVGDLGRILHYDGSDWTDLSNNDVPEPLFSVWGSSSDDVWAVGADGAMVHWDGTDWNPLPIGSPVTFNAVWGTAANDVWAAGVASGCGCGGDGVLYHYDGTDWTLVGGLPDLTGLPLYSGWSSSASDVWVGTAGAVLHYDGTDWTSDAVGSGLPLYGITGTGPLNVFAVGSFAEIARNTGSGWQPMAEPNPDLYALWGSSGTDVWGAGMELAHRDGSGSWTFQPTPSGVTLYGIWGASAGSIWAVGDRGSINFYGGADWSEVRIDTTTTLYGVWGSSASDVWAVGGPSVSGPPGGVVVHWDGGAWTSSALGADGLNAVWGSSASDVFAVGDAGTIQRWDGVSWSAMNSGVTDNLLAVWGSGAGDVYAVGDAGTVLHYDGNPSGDWTTVATPADPFGSIFGIWGSGPNDIYLLAHDGLDMVHWDGSNWRTVTAFSVNADIFMYAIWGSSNRNVFAAGDLGTVLHGQR